MRSFLLALVCWLAVEAGACFGAELSPHPLTSRLLVIYNSNLKESEALARHYARVRSIPPERVIGLPVSDLETISREEFSRTIRQPLIDLLTKKDWMPRTPQRLQFPAETRDVAVANGNQIWAIALMRGIPLRIEEDPGQAPPENLPPPLRVNRASVDSELSLLTLDNYPLAGFIPNPYYSEDRSREFTAFHADKIILVARLDGPSYADAQRLVDDAVATEAMELAGRAFFDARGLSDPNSGYKLGDDWILQAASLARSAGLSVQTDQQEALFAATEPWQDVAIYAGWYAGEATGPFTRPDFRFVPGAVAYHIHSFSAETIRNPQRNWVGPLIAKGAAATMGCVYEPYLRMTPNVGIFLRCLLDGLTFAEAAYQSQMALSWMTTVVGDPLYRPFPRPLLESLRIAESRQDRPADWVIARMLRVLAAQTGDPQQRLATVEKAAASRLTPIIMEECAEIFQELGAPRKQSIILLNQARLESTEPVAQIRLGLKEAALRAANNQRQEALAVYDWLLSHHPQAAASYGVSDAATRIAEEFGWPAPGALLQKPLAPVGADPALKP